MLSVTIDHDLPKDWQSIIEREALLTLPPNLGRDVRFRVNLSRATGNSMQREVFCCSTVVHCDGRKISHVATHSERVENCIRRSLQRARRDLRRHLEHKAAAYETYHSTASIQ